MTEEKKYDEVARVAAAIKKHLADAIAQGCLSAPPHGKVKPLGSFAEDDPETHRRMHNDYAGAESTGEASEID